MIKVKLLTILFILIVFLFGCNNSLLNNHFLNDLDIGLSSSFLINGNWTTTNKIYTAYDYKDNSLYINKQNTIQSYNNLNHKTLADKTYYFKKDFITLGAASENNTNDLANSHASIWNNKQIIKIDNSLRTKVIDMIKYKNDFLYFISNLNSETSDYILYKKNKYYINQYFQILGVKRLKNKLYLVGYYDSTPGAGTYLSNSYYCLEEPFNFKKLINAPIQCTSPEFPADEGKFYTINIDNNDIVIGGYNWSGSSDSPFYVNISKKTVKYISLNQGTIHNMLYLNKTLVYLIVQNNYLTLYYNNKSIDYINIEGTYVDSIITKEGLLYLYKDNDDDYHIAVFDNIYNMKNPYIIDIKTDIISTDFIVNGFIHKL